MIGFGGGPEFVSRCPQLYIFKAIMHESVVAWERYGCAGRGVLGLGEPRFRTSMTMNFGDGTK